MDSKAIPYIQDGVGNVIFLRIIDCSETKEACDILQQEFSGSVKVKTFKL